MDRAQLIPTHPMRYFTCGNFGTRRGFAENEATTPSNDLQWHDNLCQRCRPAIPTLGIDGTRISGLARIRRERSAIFTEAGAAEADVSLAASPARRNRSRATLCRYPIAGALGTEIAGAISRQISTATRSQQSVSARIKCSMTTGPHGRAPRARPQLSLARDFTAPRRQEHHLSASAVSATAAGAICRSVTSLE
jgi:hypothetical protein